MYIDYIVCEKGKEDLLFPEKHQRSENCQGGFVKQTSFNDPIRN